ncbi:acyl carrier protein [Pokkaliibacter plantistimulans]|uniref:Acyl carrier protein n=1 Tax=Proteobacteria bacterium 228 TaxID=2083153 RepID=A0A2S5KUA5_9PROT|nr:acyl carrier protein [Pokkaliibacter plantistimulans]PPC78444.1 acyl carrier protein [Pokkaliibacter plantistimulans]
MTLEQLFAESLGVAIDLVHDDLTYQSIPQWDSTAHMLLIARMEDEFGVMLDTDDIIDMSSVAKARQILAKYDVQC